MPSASISNLLEVRLVIDADSSVGNEFSVTCPRSGTIVDVTCNVTASAAGGFFNIFTRPDASVTLTVAAVTNDTVTRQSALSGTSPVDRSVSAGDPIRVRASSDAGGADVRGVITILIAAPGYALT